MLNIMKPAAVAALALAVVGSSFTDADAGRRHRRGNSGANLAIGLIAGALILGATRQNRAYGGDYYTSYDEPACYRGPRQCDTRWNCWVNRRGNEVCERDVVCSRPLICD